MPPTPQPQMTDKTRALIRVLVLMFGVSAVVEVAVQAGRDLDDE